MELTLNILQDFTLPWRTVWYKKNNVLKDADSFEAYLGPNCKTMARLSKTWQP